jgi:hypothetical protein
MNGAVCLLVIGELGEAGRNSLQSIQNLNPKRICIAANRAGSAWIRESIPLALAERMCFHPEVTDNFEFKEFEMKSEYSVYRSQDFRILTLLKWDLLIESMKLHTETNAVLFSDLDVYWVRDPEVVVSQLIESSSLLYVQDDSSKARPSWCCTGVMFWKNDLESIVEIEKARAQHKREIEIGRFQDDEDTFNQIISAPYCTLRFERLSQEEFLVGRNFDKVVLISRIRKKIYCFHANYLTGLDRKYKSLDAMKKFFENGKFPWRELTHFFIESKLRRVRMSIKRRLRWN